MGDIIHRIGQMLFGGARPIDRTVLIVDVLVLLVIVIEYKRTVRRERADNKRKAVVAVRINSVREMLSEGQKIQNSAVPSGHTDTDRWFQRLQRWTDSTSAALELYSAPACAAFLDVSEAPPMSIYQTIASPQDFVHLLARLQNLRRIMEHPEIYL